MADPPTRDDLAGPEPNTLDELEVLKNFLGKTQAEARKMFEARRGFSTEDFMWMALEGLRYYIVPVEQYLRSYSSRGALEFCHGLLSSLAFRVERGEIPPDLLRQIRRIADQIDMQRAKYDPVPLEDDILSEYIQTIRTAVG